MTDPHRSYVQRETLKSGVIGLVLSAAFAFLILGGQPAVPLHGPKGLVMDALPQTFVVAFMTTLAPTLLTRRLVRSNAVAGLEPVGFWLPQNAFLRSLLFALPITLVAWLGHSLLLPLITPASWAFPLVLAYKGIYGAALGIFLTPVVVRAALGDLPQKGAGASA